MSRKVPHAAFVEEYDEDAHVSLPETRQVANVVSKRSKPDLRKSAREPPFVEAASDSGYSSRTAATVNSSQSAPSGSRPPVPLKVDTSLKRSDLERVRSRTKERPPRDRTARPTPQDDKMHAGPYSAGYPPAHLPRSPSRSHRLERTYTQTYPRNYWDAERGVYHASGPVEPRQREYRYHSSQASSYDYPPQSPQTSRYPPQAVVQVSQSRRPSGRSHRSNSYHANSRPVSYHSGMMPTMNGMMYNQSPMGRYDQGPPLSSSAYSNSPAYPGHPSLYSQQLPFYPFPDATSPPERHDRSFSRPREQQRPRRPSVFEPPAMDYETSEEEEEDDEEDMDDGPMEPTPPPPPPGPPRQPRARRPSRSHDRGEDDYYRSMPPPPLKNRAPPTIIQKRPELPRKSATTASVVPERRGSRALDLSELQDALPEFGYRGSSGSTVIPERNRSLRESRRPSVAYHDSRSSARRIAVENSGRRRRPTIYDFPAEDELEDKQRDAEEYQASQSSKTSAVPMSISDALLKAKASSQAGSDSGSQKSRSASSRGSGSDARTRPGSGALTTTRAGAEDNEDIVMTLNGVTLNFTQESVGGKRISVRSGHTGAVELNIEGKRPKKYLTGGSEYTTASSNSRKGDRKSDRASRRSSRSTYNGRF